MKISRNITYKEATHSNTAIRKGIDNTPNAEQLANMQLLAEKIFEPIRTYFGVPIKVNSFFRSVKLNKAVGGSATSDHCKGMAIDISLEGQNAEIFNYVLLYLKYKQLIWEFGTETEPDWIHISYDKANLKRQNLRAISRNGKTVYL